MSKIEEVPIIWGKDDGVHYVTGTYKKDKPNEDIGYQKWEVIKTYEVEMTYEIVAKTKEEAEELLERKEIVKVEEVDDYLHACGEPYPSEIQQKTYDVETEDEGTLKKIEECIPRDDIDYDTDKRFLNYDDPEWSKDDSEWYKNKDGTDIKKEANGSTNT